MKTLHRNKRKLYLCKAYFDETTGRRKFEAPIEIYENWQVTNTDAEFLNIGLELFNYARIRTSIEHADYYHVGDKLYLFTKPSKLPTKEDPTFDEFATTADYQVYKDPIITLNEVTVWLQKLSGHNKNDNIY